PGEGLGAAADFFEGLVNRDGADGHGAVAQDPLAGLVDVFARGEVHEGVAAPLDGPTHFLDLLVDGGGDGGVADVGVDFNQEVAADDHRLELGVVDVGGDDGAAAGDFVADKLGGDLLGDGGAEGLAAVLTPEGVARAVGGHFEEVAGALELHVFADGDELHLGGDDAGAGVGELGDDLAGAGAEDGAAAAIEGFEGVAAAFLFGLGAVFFGEVAVVDGLEFAAGDDLGVGAFGDPV